ncbi:S-adenosyl-L-methionine-dependent methyltransferase [Dunaliella salina]|uniref:S-adenosyl-L-methionine-dependent methyltransferase n=1 Tax=Dunaliella salina TaxID=3046 RepID=A0ABQ7GNN3_DUNSA|nr:S-adenosyl-L-methionine-dependent methyltransferase [Dunaliella salina]|eukprot:KAF5836193.1 S-adenosyl-L-methionine-dependent methyltransferase [Dunaliella salina]
MQSFSYEAQPKEKQNQVGIPCPHLGPCGGCSLQSLTYEAQLQEKQNQVVQTLTRVGKLAGVEDVIRPVIGCNPAFGLNNHGSDIFGYRNKLQFTFSSLCWEPATAGSTAFSKGSPEGSLPGGSVVTRPVLGFLRPGSQTEVLPVTKCWLQDAAANAILENVRRDALVEHGLLPYNDPSGKGFLKNLVIRSSKPAPPSLVPPSDAHPANHQQQQRQQQAGPSKLLHATESSPGASQPEKEYLVTFVVTSRDAVAALQPVADALVASIPQGSRMTNLSQKSSQQQAQNPPSLSGRGWSGRSSDIRLVAGSRAYLVETMKGLHLRVSPDSFLQTNTAQAEVLYGAISDAAQLKPSDSLLDLYCGAGSIGLSLAQQCAHVVGYEAEGSAIADAYHNAAVNNVHNASFGCVDLTKGVPDPSERVHQMQLHTAGQGPAHESDPGVLPSADQQGVQTAQDMVIASASMAEGSSAAGRKSTGARTAWLSPDVIVCDPARAGLSTAVVEYLRASTARRCVYVSCNPATQARDLALLCRSADEVSGGAPGKHKSVNKMLRQQRGQNGLASAGRGPSRLPQQQQRQQQQQQQTDVPLQRQQQQQQQQLPAFRLVSLQAVDMFPHTDHVETVAVLDRCC